MIPGTQFATSLPPRVRQYQLLALVLGIAALIASGVGCFWQPRQFFFSWLFGWLFWAGLSFGCIQVTMVHHLTGGRWGFPTRRFLEAGANVLPVMSLLFIPVFFGLRQLYPWANPAELAANPVLQGRQPYLSPLWFIARSVLFLAVSSFMAWRLRSWSLQQDVSADAEPEKKARKHSGMGVVFFPLMATFIYVDWVMSLEVRWFSTMFPVIMLIGQILAAYAFSIVTLSLFQRVEPFASVTTKVHYHHLGNLVLTFVLFWTYISFGQFLIVYAGDLPPEVDWYLHRIADSWKLVLWGLFLFHFFVPFFLLLFRGIKKRVTALAVIAAAVFLMHIVDAYWLVMPSFHQSGVNLSWMDFLTPIGFGGIWVSVFLNRLKSAALLPQKDPGMQFAFVYGH